MAKTGQQTKERQHLVVSLSPQSDRWTEGPTVKDMLSSGFRWVRKQGEEWREELSQPRGRLNLQGDPENIPITKELMEKVNRIRQEEGKKPLELPGERWNFNMKYALMDNGKFKVGWGQKLESAKRFVNGKSICFFWCGRQIVGFYGCAELSRKNFFVADDGFEGNIRAPVEFCVKFDKPLPTDLKVVRGLCYIDDDKARELIEKAISEQCAPKEKLWRVYEAVWRKEGNEPEFGSKVLRYFAAKGFHFTPAQVAAFYAALKTKGFVILSGLSGTGKTKLAQLFAELLCPCSKCHKSKEETEGEMQAESQKQTEGECKTCTHLFLSVRPDWRDSKALLGYYNPLTGNYESTPLLRFLQQACEDYKNNKDKANPYFVILDEMNLAHVEYYFADFLSVLESGRDEEGWTKEALRLHSFSQSLRDQDGNEIPPTLPLPPNLYIIGTVNIDETTYMFSPKVLDRAFTLEFREVNFSNYPPEVDEKRAKEIAEKIRENEEFLRNFRNDGKFYAVVADKDKVKKALQALGNKKAELEKLNGILQPYDLHFGYRVLDEIALFVQNAINAPDVIGKLNDNKALDYAVLMKVLPKFHGPRQKLEKPLREVLKWAAEENVPDWVKDTSKPIGLEQVTEALRKWEQSDALQQAQQKAGQGADGQERQPVNAQQGQDNQTETTSDQATQVEAKGQSGASATKPFKGHFRYPNTAKKVLQMLRQLYETGFASFAQ